jgi:hypothetical protein
MPWLIYDEDKARAAGCGPDDEIIYVLSIADVSQAYDDMRDDDDIYPKPGKDAPDWSDLPPELRTRLTTAARKSVESAMESSAWVDAIRDGIEDTLKTGVTDAQTPAE